VKYKLLVMDLDGTLLSSNENISIEDRDAIAEACRSGIRVSVSTGRSLMSCRHIIDQLSLDGYHITFDGGLVSDADCSSEVYAQPLKKTVVKQAIDFAYANEISLELFSNACYFAEKETWSTQAHRDFFGIEPTIADFNQIWEQERIIKGGLVTTNPEEAEKARRFCQHFEDRLHLSWARTPAYHEVDFINVLAPGVSKGEALKALTSHLGIPLAEVMAIGDGRNDISLLSVVGLAVAMGNAMDEVKAVADYITLDVEHNGVAAAINEFLL